MAIFASVEYVEVSITAATEPVVVNLSKGQDETKCTPLGISARTTDSTVDVQSERFALVEFIDNGGTPAVRVTSDQLLETSAIIYQIFVVEWGSAIVVQQVTATGLTDTTTTANQAITDVGDQDSAFFMFSYQRTSGVATDDFDDVMVRLSWNGSSTSSITFDRNAGDGAIEGVLYVVEANSAEFDVQHTAEIAMAASAESATATITSITTADTFLVHSNLTTNADDDIRDSIVQADLQDATTVRVRRSVTANAAASTSSRVQVVTCASNEWDVQRNGALTLGTATTTEDITAINETRSVVHMLHSAGFTALGRSDSISGADVDDVMCAISFLDSDTISVEKRVATTTNDIVSYEVIQFAADAVGGRIMSSLVNFGGLAGKGGIAGIGGGLAN